MHPWHPQHAPVALSHVQRAAAQHCQILCAEDRFFYRQSWHTTSARLADNVSKQAPWKAVPGTN